ncbi:putative 3-phenylpropionate permease [Escherichia coli]|uniref:Putative 3-phenylpropionate permease n=1 Tax=Escherichia coli TaxID=562 RepID=A0A2X3K3M0_ECOLX|nr:putative 3-phenylpropionate permease [Escherichia coli]
MLLGFLIRPTIQPQGASRQQESTGWSAWLALVRQNWRFLACVCLLQGAHAAYYGFSAIYWQASWLLGLGGGVFVVAGPWWRKSLSFALSNKLFRRCSARDMLLISAILRRSALGHYGSNYGVAVVDSGANSALRHLHGLPPGRHALYCCSPG